MDSSNAYICLFIIHRLAIFRPDFAYNARGWMSSEMVKICLRNKIMAPKIKGEREGKCQNMEIWGESQILKTVPTGLRM